MATRSRPRAYLLLARVSNLPTVWTNVLAAVAGAGVSISGVDPGLAGVIMALSMLYSAGMFLNDVCDASVDAIARPDRPIPSGDVSWAEALQVTIGLMLGALGILVREPHGLRAIGWGVALIAAIVYYDYHHKGKWYGPIVMGLCRALVYCVAASSLAGAIAAPVLIAAAVMWVYIVALTWVAKAADLGYAVPWMLAGICLVDAGMILFMGQPQLAFIAATGFPVTLALQRVVPGT